MIIFQSTLYELLKNTNLINDISDGLFFAIATTSLFEPLLSLSRENKRERERGGERYRAKN